MGKKSNRDPYAPKRNLSAYLLYQNAMRDHFRAQNPGMTFGQLAKYTSAMYAEMSPQEKESWNQRAEDDKIRYLRELSTYVPPPGYDAKGDVIQAAFNQEYGVPPTHAMPVPPVLSIPSHPRKDKPVRDANAPKRNVSAYLLYQNAMRDRFKTENPGMSFGELAKYTSHMYRNLSPEERAHWDERARLDKARYDAEIARYVPPPGHDARGNSLERSLKRRNRGPKDPAAPKRARGSFVFFTFEMRPIIMKENPNLEFVQMGTVLGERWRALSPEQKKRYENMAATDKARFQVEMEQYKANLVVRNSTTGAQQPPHRPPYPYPSQTTPAPTPYATVSSAYAQQPAPAPTPGPAPAPTPTPGPAPQDQPQPYTPYEQQQQQQKVPQEPSYDQQAQQQTQQVASQGQQQQPQQQQQHQQHYQQPLQQSVTTSQPRQPQYEHQQSVTTSQPSQPQYEHQQQQQQDQQPQYDHQQHYEQQLASQQQQYTFEPQEQQQQNGY